MKADRYPFAIALALSLALFLMVYNYWQIGRFNPLGGLAALAERLRDRETPVEWFRSANSDATVGTLDAWGIVERAVSYWWGQHAEHRLRGPFHYYIPLLAVYEWPLALMAMAGTLGALGRRRRRWLLALGLALAAALGGWLAAGTLGAARLDDLLHVQSRAHLVAAAALGAHATLLTVFYLLDGRVMRAFLLFWTVTTLAAVSYAGEKTPWLTVHVALPLALMAADAMVAAGAGWMRRGVGHRWRRGARRAAAALLAAGALVGGLKWSLDLGRLLADAHNPAERLVYNHTTPAVKVCAERIRQMDARFRAQGRRCEIGMTGEVPWPMYWYLRELDYREISGQTIDAADAEVVLCNPEHAIDADNFRRDYLTRTLPLRVAWVPPTVSPGRCFLAGADGEDWPMEPPAGARKEIAWLWRYWLRRELFPQPKPAHVTEFVVGWRRPAAAATDGLDGMDGMDTMDSMDGMDGMSYHGPTGGNPAESNSATSLVGPAIP